MLQETPVQGGRPDRSGRLRAARAARGLALEDLARETGLEAWLLRDIEEGRREPTLGTLWKLTAGLGVPFAELLGVSQRGVTLQRRAEAALIASADGVLESRPLVPPGSHLWVEAYELTLAPGGAYPSEPHPRGTRETLVVLAGALRVELGEDAYDLAEGDTLSFAADAPHAYINPGGIPGKYHDIIVYEH